MNFVILAVGSLPLIVIAVAVLCEYLTIRREARVRRDARGK